MTEAEVLSNLASSEAWRVTDAVRAWAGRVRGEEADAAPLAEALVPLAGHASADVRREVADAADLFPERAFDDVIGRLGADAHHYVVKAAERAARRRAAQRAERARTDEDLEAMAGMLAEMENTYDAEAREMAERLVRRGRELFTRRMHHEMTKAYSGLEMALVFLKEGLEKSGEIDRGALRKHAEVALARKRHLVTIAARASAGTMVLTPKLAEEKLASVVLEARAQLVERLGDRAQANRVAVRIAVDADLTLRADRGALLQALANVLQNGVEAYGAAAGEIVLDVRARVLCANSQVELTVTDRGRGMDAATMREMFTPFGSTKPGGTGVGMIIVRRMIEEVHGGTLSLESKPGVGTTVTMVIPREAP